MTWVRLDDKFWRNQKMHRVSFAARGLWLDALSYCADTPELTGFMTFKEAKERGPQRLIDELVKENAWEPLYDGYLIHDFDHYIDRGSRDRCRAWRERKRAESERHANVTKASPRATGLETISTSRLNPVPSRPEPDPADGEDFQSDEPAVYGVPKTNMHVERFHTLSETLKNLHIQPAPREEAIG